MTLNGQRIYKKNERNKIEFFVAFEVIFTIFKTSLKTI